MLFRACRMARQASTAGRSRFRGFSTTQAGAAQSRRSAFRVAAGVTGALGAAAAAFSQTTFVDADSLHTTLLCWGSDLYGQLGVGNGADLQSPTHAASSTPMDIVCVDAAGLTTGLLTSNGDIYTFGCGMHGRLGHGATLANVTVPKHVTGIPKPCSTIAVGENHIAAITVDGELYSAGRQIHGSLGHANTDKGKPALVQGALAGKRVVSVACGTKHTLVVTEDFDVYAFGEGRTLALGQGKDKAKATSPKLVEALQGLKVVQVQAGNGYSVAMTQDGKVYTWGANEYGQLGRGAAGRYLEVGRVEFEQPVAKLSAGDFHVLALAKDGTVYAFGNGDDGRTGLGNEEDSSSPQEVRGLEGQRVIKIAAGGAHSIAVTEDNNIFTWGKGRNGQLGQGDQLASVAAYRNVPIQIDSVGTVTSVAAGKDHSCVVAVSPDA